MGGKIAGRSQFTDRRNKNSDILLKSTFFLKKKKSYKIYRNIFIISIKKHEIVDRMKSNNLEVTIVRLNETNFQA